MVVPAPASAQFGVTPSTFLTAESRIVASTGEARSVAAVAAPVLRALTGLPLPIAEEATRDGDLALGVEGSGHPESYRLTTEGGMAVISAPAPAGLWFGVQTLRQLVGPGGAVAPATVSDAPRFAHRGAMLDVARHFFSVADVLRFLDAIALLKLNVLHLHLTDDQGWRLEIDGWPELTGIGASTSVGGESPGFYSQRDYARIVDYAAERFITVIPEIDLPGHTNAALSAYPTLTRDGIAPAPYEGTDVGFSTLSADDEQREITDRFLADVLGQVAALTPGPFVHVGGDESLSTSPEDYLELVRRITAAVTRAGRTPIGWHEMGVARDLPAGTVGQYWDFRTPRGHAAERTLSFVEQGGAVILSPADAIYLDIAYPEDPEGPGGRTLGQRWTGGPTSLRDAYGWDPADVVPGLPEDRILGVEAPVWTETMRTIDEVEFMAFPRLAAAAELAWSPRVPVDAPGRFESFAARLGALGPLFEAAGIRFFATPEVDWAQPK